MEDKKPWWKSITVWGAGLTIFSIVAPKYAPIVGPVVSEAGAIVAGRDTAEGKLLNLNSSSFQKLG